MKMKLEVRWTDGTHLDVHLRLLHNSRYNLHTTHYRHQPPFNDEFTDLIIYSPRSHLVHVLRLVSRERMHSPVLL